MGPYLSHPKKDKEVENGNGNKVKHRKLTLIQSKQVRYGACGMQGWRNTMEDSHICCTTLDNNVSVFGVFDGHGGKKNKLKC